MKRIVVQVKDGYLQLLFVQIRNCCTCGLSLLLSAVSGTLVFPEHFPACQLVYFPPFSFSALPLLLTKQYSRANFISCSLANVNTFFAVIREAPRTILGKKSKSTNPKGNYQISNAGYALMYSSFSSSSVNLLPGLMVLSTVFSF